MPRPEGRPGFREWVDRQVEPSWPLMPLTHITSGVRAEDIARAGEIRPGFCPVADGPAAFFFYGRPAYRTEDSAVLKLEGACPFCFIVKEKVIGDAENIHAFDTGAYHNRMFDHVMTQDMRVEDFSLGTDVRRPNKLIAKVFATMSAYYDGDRAKVIAAKEGTPAHEFHARAYIELLASAGRNEPDDRVHSIEIAISEAVPILGNLMALVVPDTIWREAGDIPWLQMIRDDGAQIVPYRFAQGRSPEHYHTLMEGVVRDLYREFGFAL